MQNILNILQGWLVDASPSIARQGRSLAVTDTLSTSFVDFRQHGPSARSKVKDVSCRILIAVVMLSALFAVKLSNIQRQT